MLGVALVSVSLGGCEKSSDTHKREAEKAAAEANTKQAEATREAEQKAREARTKADNERSEFHAAVARERVEYRAKIHDALDGVDQKLRDYKVDLKTIRRGDRSKDISLYGTRPTGEFNDLEKVLVRRDRLMDDDDQIDRVLDSDWPEFKKDIDRELAPEKPPTTTPGRI
jgi:hypothetical protein